MNKSTKTTAFIAVALIGASAAFADAKLDALPAGAMSEAELESIALGYAQGEIVDFEIESEDGKVVVEYEIQTAEARMEVELDALTGALIELEAEDDDDHDNDHDDD